MAGVYEWIEGKIGGKLGVAVLVGLTVGGVLYLRRKKEIPRVGILDCVGNTPLIYLPKLSKAANCNIYVLDH